MKKVSARFVVMIALFTASVLSYAYLSVLSPEAEAGTYATPLPSGETLQEIPQDEVEETEIILPDITLLKRIVSLGRHLLPGS